jgi:hypothetical protein
MSYNISFRAVNKALAMQQTVDALTASVESREASNAEREFALANTAALIAALEDDASRDVAVHVYGHMTNGSRVQEASCCAVVQIVPRV